ncbi:DUF6036 family nucleotidyltransferase [Rhodococcus sp. JT-3]|uniref:DUF6036 family nucleotidyltransferase n=1 Tax=Rhodococcus sp. JT-3 TaxID=1973213 RepID=UPI0018EF2301|nr:DUF6036 family nucleotidyltransferase [Rhodococcus sp. JT-3]
MNREDLAKAVIAACKWLDEPQVVIFGSQSLLGSYDDTELPDEATRSREVDMTPASAFRGGIGIDEKVSVLDVWVGEDSPFHSMHGIYVEGIHKETVVLPHGWENRLVHFDVTDGSGNQTYGRKGLCLEPTDLCISKLIAGREKDHEYVGALIRENIITPEAMLDRIDKSGIEWPPGYPDNRELALTRAQNWLHAQKPLQSEPEPSASTGALSAAMRSHPRTIKKLLNTRKPRAQDQEHERRGVVDNSRAVDRDYGITD